MLNWKHRNVILVICAIIVSFLIAFFSCVFRQEAAINASRPTPRPNPIIRIDTGDAIITPVGDADSFRFVRFQLRVGIDNTRGSDSVDAERIVRENVEYIRTIATEYIARTPIEELETAEARTGVRTEILEHLVRELNNALIVDVTFSEWLLV